MLSFEIANQGKTIQVYCDRDGLRTLLEKLESLQDELTGHIHLRTLSCGGKELSELNPWGTKGVSEVIVTIGGD